MRIKEITPQELPMAARFYYDRWQVIFKGLADKLEIEPLNWKGEDKNILAHNDKESYKAWFSQPPGASNTPYRDKGFYSRELTWLSRLYSPRIIVEFGTNLGQGALMLSLLNPYAKIYTVDIKKKTFLPGKKEVDVGYFVKKAKRKNVEFVYGQSRHSYIDNVNLCFIDGNHNEPTVFGDSWRAFLNRSRDSWVIIWHDCDNEPGVRPAIERFCSDVGKKAIKLFGSSIVWMGDQV